MILLRGFVVIYANIHPAPVRNVFVQVVRVSGTAPASENLLTALVSGAYV